MAILRKGANAFSTLKDYTFVTVQEEPFKEYCFSTGTFAAIYKAAKESNEYAIRCFLNGKQETFRRYKIIASYLKAKDLPWEVDFNFLDKEIEIENELYPVIKMKWVTGKPLNNFIDEIIFDDSRLRQLQIKLVGLSESLEANLIGHGDLQCGNILVEKQNSDFIIKLVDYDGMYVPALKGHKNLEAGRQEFQHPSRTPNDFSEKIDRFSIWVMLTALEALKIDKNLWKQATQGGYNTFENLLFTGNDFIDPDQSGLFQKLRSYNKASLNFYLNKLYEFCLSESVDRIEKPQLYGQGKGSKDGAGDFYEVLIKSIPSGKDVIQNGMKKGITPVSLIIDKAEFQHILVVNGPDKLPVLVTEKNKVYELDFTQLIKAEEIQKPVEAVNDEIISFKADKTSIEAGDTITIDWFVKGREKVYISNIGEVKEKIGKRTVSISNTTEYTLIAGASSKSIVIYVNPRREAQPAPVRPPGPGLIKWGSRIKWRKVLAIMFILIAVGSLSMYFIKQPSVTHSSLTSIPVVPQTFTRQKVVGFLDKLYSAYNKRDINSIIENYGDNVDQYNQLYAVNHTVLKNTITDLFITPAFYHCTPLFTTLSIFSNDHFCTITIVVKEEMKKDKDSEKNNYTTTLQYSINKAYKILSEKTVSIQ